MERERLFQDPFVKVETIRLHEGRLLVGEMQHDLQGGIGLSGSIALRLKGFLQRSGRSAYYLTWEGSKVPRGANIDGRIVHNASNNYIAADFGYDVFGTYVRVERQERDNPHQQEMVVLVPAPEEDFDVE